MDQQNQEVTPEEMLPQEQITTDTTSETNESTADKKPPKELTPAQRNMMLATSAIALLILLMGGAYYGGYVKGSYETRKRMEKMMATSPTPKVTPTQVTPISHAQNPSTFTWPEYTNVISGISLKYPPESGKPYVIEDDGKTRKDATGLDTKPVFFEQTAGDTFSLSFTPFTQTLDSFISSQEVPADPSEVENLKTQMTNAGVDMQWYTTSGSEKSPAHDTVYFMHNKIVYVLKTKTLFSPQSLQQILSTITFEK